MSPDLGILVVTDDPIGRESTVLRLREAGHDAEARGCGAEALERLTQERWDVVLTGLRWPGMDGVELLREIRRRAPGVEVISTTALGTVEAAFRTLRVGASDLLSRPLGFAELESRLAQLQRRRRREFELENLRGFLGDTAGTEGLVGRSEPIQVVRDRIQSFARNSAPVLVTGETGTGKELVARALHRASGRSPERFIPVGCGTIPRELGESELFGHEKGSFTGASRLRKGSFERADGGTLLLDDVDDLAPGLQAKLLRVLQEGTLHRVGGSREIRVDVRVIATSKVDLHDSIEERLFRADLYYRLRGLEIHLPPLRERGDDCLLLADHFLSAAARESGGPAKRLSPPAAERLLRHAWPGNVRELRRAVESMVVLCPGSEILLEHLPDFLQRPRANGKAFHLRLDSSTQVSFTDLVKQFEAELVGWAMERSGGNQTRAARLLGLPRTTLQSRLRDLGLAGRRPPEGRGPGGGRLRPGA